MRLEDKGLSSLELSMAAALSMTFDHAAVVLLNGSAIYTPFRAVGRIAFVIFAFLMAQSVEKTSSVKRFCIRLALFAAITEPIFDITFYGKWFYAGHQNVFFTLLAGVAAVRLYSSKNMKTLPLCVITVLAQLLGFDYGGIGVILIFSFWMWGRENAAYVIAAFAVITAADGDIYNFFAMAAIPFVMLYNGSRGGENHTFLRRWSFYFYYPLHIAVLGIVSVAKQII
jgi:hypothetical protein